MESISLINCSPVSFSYRLRKKKPEVQQVCTILPYSVLSFFTSFASEISSISTIGRSLGNGGAELKSEIEAIRAVSVPDQDSRYHREVEKAKVSTVIIKERADRSSVVISNAYKEFINQSFHAYSNN